MTNSIDYGNKMHRAMRALIAEVLTEIGRDGLPGDHHFFITFDTTHPDVEMADWLFDRYPEEMTIVIQHWFDALFVGEDGFQITLNFGDTPERLSVPFVAIRTFVDPSVEFGLRFETQEEKEHEVVELPELLPDPSDRQTTQLHKGSGKVKGKGRKTNVDAKTGNKANKKADATPETKTDKAKTKAADVVSLDSFRK